MYISLRLHIPPTNHRGQHSRCIESHSIRRTTCFRHFVVVRSFSRVVDYFILSYIYLWTDEDVAMWTLVRRVLSKIFRFVRLYSKQYCRLNFAYVELNLKVALRFLYHTFCCISSKFAEHLLVPLEDLISTKYITNCNSDTVLIVCILFLHQSSNMNLRFYMACMFICACMRAM